MACAGVIYDKGFDRKAAQCIPATVRLISACRAAQKAFGEQTGACTRALLNAVFPNNAVPDSPQRWADVIRGMRQQLKRLGLPEKQVPQLTSSRWIHLSDTMYIVEPQKTRGTKRAVLIGVQNYTTEHGMVNGAHNDVFAMKDFLLQAHGFAERNITVLLDDDRHAPPTRTAILTAFRRVVTLSQAGDTVVCHFSGHGERVKDKREYILPQDAENDGRKWISSDELYNVLVSSLGGGVTMTFVMDCCHSGDMLNLPYKFLGNGTMEFMERNPTVLRTIAGVGAVGVTIAGLYVFCACTYCADCLDATCCCCDCNTSSSNQE